MSATGAKILVIRGGAIGDFILTLPSIALLREAFPEAHLEILGYKHIVAVAEQRYYAHAVRSIEYAGLASFFIPGAQLSSDLVSYFASFHQVVCYLFDPDGFFEENLRRAGVKNLIMGYSRVEEGTGDAAPVHAARQIAAPLERMALFLEDGQSAIQPRLHPSPEDRALAAQFLSEGTAEDARILAVHPGSGGAHKIWPLEHWADLLNRVRALPSAPRVLLVGGEADAVQLAALRQPGDLIAASLSLPHLAAVLERCSLFLGHDSGVSHLAAAAGLPCMLMFGPTNPQVWAPPGAHVRVLTPPTEQVHDLAHLSVDQVFSDLKGVMLDVEQIRLPECEPIG